MPEVALRNWTKEEVKGSWLRVRKSGHRHGRRRRCRCRRGRHTGVVFISRACEHGRVEPLTNLALNNELPHKESHPHTAPHLVRMAQ